MKWQSSPQRPRLLSDYPTRQTSKINRTPSAVGEGDCAPFFISASIC
jgi:hypothetical protein